MNYEEKYNEILEWARKNKARLNGVPIEEVLPELAESDEERIRKELVEAFEALDIDSSWNGIPVKSILAWLKDQKPAGKQDYTTLTDIERAINRGFLSAGVTNIPVEIIEETAKECIALMKPAEWSEEDEKKMIFLERLIEHNVPDGQYGWADGRKGGFVKKSEAISMLKSLRPQPKPEWSEEDDEMRNRCISSIEEAKDNRYYYKETDGDTSYDEEISWLKSLRPSWKPSEEQMNKLKEVIYGLCTCGNGPVLKSLYEDLKKLM